MIVRTLRNGNIAVTYGRDRAIFKQDGTCIYTTSKSFTPYAKREARPYLN